MPSKKQSKPTAPQINKKKKKIVDKFAKLAKKLGRTVQMNDLIDDNLTKDSVTHHFQSLTRLEAEAREQHPDKFFDAPLKDIIGETAVLNRLQSAVKSYKRFVITTAVTGCEINANFYDSVKNYCARRDAALLVLTSMDPAHNKNVAGEYGTISKRLLDDIIVTSNIAMNSNLLISTIKVSAKQIDPVTGLARIGQTKGSFIYASPKQRLKASVTSNIKMPHFSMSTGAITEPNYETSKYMSERTAYIADHDHVLGALIVEIEDDAIFHFRQIQCKDRKSFIDLGKRYLPDGKVENVVPEAFVLGDWHSGETDPLAKNAWLEVSKSLKPKKLFIHDGFNGSAINHHEDHQRIQKAKKANRGELSLSAELDQYAKDLQELSSIVGDVIIVKSNHDDFLERYLQDCKYKYDPHNHELSLKLALSMFQGENPVKAGVLLSGHLKNKNIKWLSRDEDYKIAGIQLGAHGDKGANGARGSLQTMEQAYGQSVTGHAHTPEILRGAWQVGTSSLLKLDYNIGPSSWLHTSCLIYSDGSRQLLNSINGAWKL